MVSIITPWLNCPELIKMYEPSVQGAEVIIVDNGSDHDAAIQIQQMVKRLGGHYIRNKHNAKFAEANNQGAAFATHDVIMFLNNDIECRAPDWVDRVANEVHEGALYGPSKLTRNVGGLHLPYIEGFCIAARRATWESLGWWDARNYTGMYWEDNDLCYRAGQMGYRLIETLWPVYHHSNYTSKRTSGAYDSSQNNAQTFAEKVTSQR